MAETVQAADGGTAPGRPARVSALFPAQAGRFDDPATRAHIDELVAWVEERFREDLARRPSKHVYVDTLPPEAVARIDRLRGSEEIVGRIARHFGPGWAVSPMASTDELYLSHYNKDRGGDQGLFDKHYDGNLRFLPASAVVRALIYLQSDATYTVVFADSGLAKAFGSHEFGLLDFHRELHWVEGEFNPSDRQRILLKCNYLVTPRDAPVWTTLVRGANTAVFYVVKAAMEYSKSPSTPAQAVVGFFCNFFRRMNNAHPFVPFAFLGLVFAVLVATGVRLAG
jgi:hypothetical protein